MFYAVNSSSLPEPGTARKTGGTEPRNVTLYKKECLADLVSNLLIAKIGKKE